MRWIQGLCVSLLAIGLWIEATGAVQAQETTILRQATYELDDTVTGNPLMGFALQAERQDLEADVQLVYVDVTWQELEPQEGQYAFEAIEASNQWARWRQEGKHVVLRFVMDLPGETRHRDIPDWLYDKMDGAGDWYDTDYGQGFSPRYDHPVLIEAHQKAVAAMGQRWSQEGLVAFIELGSVGHWGEWHVHYERGLRRLPDEATLARYVAPWREAFPQTQILMRRAFRLAQTYQMGLYNDMVGEDLNTGNWLDWMRRGGTYDQNQEASLVAMPDVWKATAIGGEMTSAHPMEALMGSRLATTLKQIDASHMTFIGPKAPKRAVDAQAYETLLSHLGYKLRVSQATLSQAGDQQTLTLTLENRGAAPFYYDWPVTLYVLDDQGQTVARQVLDVALSDLVPGRQATVTAALTLGSQAARYEYRLGIVDPMTGRDAVRLAMPGYDAETRQTVLFPAQ